MLLSNALFLQRPAPAGGAQSSRAGTWPAVDREDTMRFAFANAVLYALSMGFIFRRSFDEVWCLDLFALSSFGTSCARER